MPDPFHHELRVRYAECDAQGVVFNANYLTFFDVALTELWRERGVPYEELVESGTDMVVAEVRLRYLAPVRFDEVISIEALVARLGTTSISFALTVRRGEVTAAEAELRYVFVRAGTGEKAEIPDDVRQAVAPLVIEAEAPAA